MFINDIECLCLEIKLRNKCWLLCYVYNPHKSNAERVFTSISKYLEHYYERHDNIVVFGDFNSSGSHPFLMNL